MLVNQSVKELCLSIYEVLTSYLCKHTHEHWVEDLTMFDGVIVQEAVVGVSLAYLHIKTANSLFIDVWDQAALRIPKM